MANQERPKRQDVKNFIYNEQGNVVGASFRQYARAEQSPQSAEHKATAKPETGKTPLLSQELAGAQAMLLLGNGTPDNRARLTNINTAKIAELATAENPPPTKTLNKASYHERDEFWNGENSPYKHLTHAEKLATWENMTNTGLLQKDRYDAEQRQFLAGLGIDVTKDNPAQQLYQHYFKEQKGDIGYFARRIAHNGTPEQLNKHRSLIRQLSGVFGQQSAEVAQLLAEGIKNVETNPDGFAERALQDISRREAMPGYEVLTSIQAASKQWEAKRARNRQERERNQAQGTIYEKPQARNAAEDNPRHRQQEHHPDAQETPLDERAIRERLQQDANQFVTKVRNLPETEDIPKGWDWIEHELSHNRERPVNWHQLLRIAGERYNMPLAFVTKLTEEEGIQEGYLMLQYPKEKGYENWILPYYDPARGKQEAQITHYHERGFFNPWSNVTFGEIPDMKAGELGREYMHINKEPWIITYNGKLMQDLKQANFYNLTGGIPEKVFVPLQKPDDEKNRSLYSFYMGATLRGLADRGSLYFDEQDGIEQFRTDFHQRLPLTSENLRFK